MTKRQLELTEQEMGQLRRAEAQTRDVHEVKRLQAIRMYGSGVPMVTIQDMVGAGARGERIALTLDRPERQQTHR